MMTADDKKDASVKLDGELAVNEGEAHRLEGKLDVHIDGETETERVQRAADIETDRVAAAASIESDRKRRAASLASDVAAAAVLLSESMDALRTQIAGIDTYGKRTRHLTIGIILSVVVDVALSIIAIIGLNTASEASQGNHQTLVTNCHQSNTTRKSDRELWTYALDQIVPANAPAAAQASKAKFEVRIQTTFAPRDCDAIK
jgi:hypothetical protein